MKKLIISGILILAFVQHGWGRPMELADPTILVDGDTYYMYGTSSPSDNGFEVYMSHDLRNWTGPAGVGVHGFALTKGDAFGSTGFWAPQIIHTGETYYMIYTADEQIAVATSSSPLGPFIDTSRKALPCDTRRIDPFLFRSADGCDYLFHVRLDGQNKICCTTPQGKFFEVATSEPGTWEDTANATWRVCEGPTVIEYGGKYHLFYSANDYRNIDYAVGHAVADKPEGPWKKSPTPIISRHNTGMNGTGHGDVFKDLEGNLRYVFHAHASEECVSPRKTYIVTLRPLPDGSFAIDDTSIIQPEIKDR